MNNGSFLYAITCGICAGLALADIFGAKFAIAASTLALSLILIALGCKYPKFFIAAAACAAVSLGIMRGAAFEAGEAAQTLPQFIGTTAYVEGRVADDPDKRETSLHLTIEVQKINDTVQTGTLLAIVPRETKVNYGNTVVVQGAIEAPQSFITDTGHLFDYPGYLRARGIEAIAKKATMVSDTPGSWSPIGVLFTIKHTFETSLERLFPEPDGALLEGILLGSRSGIPKDVNNAFIASGLVHVVVLSGHNITVVSEGVFRALSFLPTSLQIGLGAVTMVLFALMTGAGATTVRALVMALVALLARYMHRKTLAMRSLALAGAGMVLWNPPTLLHDPSFILSMLATFGLITLAPWVEQKIYFIPNYKRFDIRSIAATTIAVQLFVLPALLYFTGVLSFVSLPANVIALPIVPFAMFMGFVAGVLGFIHPVLGFAPMIVCDLLLKWMMFVAHATTAMPFSTTIIPEFSPWIMVAVYVPLLAFAISRYLQT